MRALNLIGRNKPWSCTLHGIDCPAGSAGCPACVAEHSLHKQLREARAEAEHWRRLFAGLVAETVGVADPGQPAAVTRIPMRYFMVDDLVLVSWPVVEFTYDFSVYRKGSEPVVPSAEQAARDGLARVFSGAATVRDLLTDPTGDEA